MKIKAHRRHFVPVEHEGHAAAAVVQVAAVGLALGARGLSRRGSAHGAHSPVVAGWGQTRQVAVLQTSLPGRAALPPWWAEPAGTTAADHLETEGRSNSPKWSSVLLMSSPAHYTASSFLARSQLSQRLRSRVTSRRNAAALLLDGLFYLCAVHVAVGAAAAVALLFPAAAVGKLKSGIVASLSDADD